MFLFDFFKEKEPIGFSETINKQSVESMAKLLKLALDQRNHSDHTWWGGKIRLYDHQVFYELSLNFSMASYNSKDIKEFYYYVTVMQKYKENVLGTFSSDDIKTPEIEALFCDAFNFNMKEVIDREDRERNERKEKQAALIQKYR